LSPLEVSTLLQSFEKMKRELKKDYPKGLSKDEFVQFIKLKVATPGYSVSTTVEPALYEPLEKVNLRKLYDRQNHPFRDIADAYDGLYDPEAKLTKEERKMKYEKQKEDERIERIMREQEIKNRNILLSKTLVNKKIGIEAKEASKKVLSELKTLNTKAIEPTAIEPTAIESPKTDTMTTMMTDAATKMSDTTKKFLKLVSPKKTRYHEYVIPGTKTTIKLNETQNKIFEVDMQKYSSERYATIKNLDEEQIINYINENNSIPMFLKSKILERTVKKNYRGELISNLTKYTQDICTFNYANSKADPTEGEGLKRKKRVKFHGKGYTLKTDTTNNDTINLPNQNIKIDCERLRKNNILAVKYKCNNNAHPNLKIQRVSQSLSDVLYDILNNKYDSRFYKLLNPSEKELVKDFIRITKHKIDADPNETEEFNKNYEILYSQIMSGNDSKEIKAKLKEYTLFGMKTGRLNKAEAMTTLVQLS
jgi:hypothetical protein